MYAPVSTINKTMWKGVVSDKINRTIIDANINNIVLGSPSLYRININDTKTTLVPVSFCRKINATGISINAIVINNDLKLISLIPYWLK